MHRLFVIAALGVAAWAMVFKTGVASSDEAGILLHLPEQVDGWTGVELLFCSSRSCGGQFTAARLENAAVCPRCGARLTLDSVQITTKGRARDGA